MSWWPRVPAALLVVVGVLVACGDDGEPPAPATTTGPTTTEPPTTITTVDPFTVPDDPADITEAYVEAVLRELERINGDALRLAIAEGMSPAVADLLLAIGSPDFAERRADLLLEESEAGWPGIRQSPGDVITFVTDILAATVDCVGVAAKQDFSRVGEGNNVVSVRIELERREPTTVNRTGWVFVLRQPVTESSELDEPCSS